MRSRLLRFIVVALAGWGTMGAADGQEATQAPPYRRVAITPPPSYWGTLPTDEASRHGAAMAGFLGEQLALCSGVRLVSEPRAATLFQRLTAGEYGIRPENWFAVANDIMPVDAIVTFPGRDGQSSVRVILADRVLDLPVLPQGEGLFPRIQRAADFLADALALPDADRRILKENDFPSEDAMITVYLMSRYSVHWMYCPGAARLEILGNTWSAHRGDTRVGREILRAAALQMSRAQRRRQAVASSPIQMAHMALLTVLGTRFEQAADEVVRLQPASFATILLDLAQPYTRNDDDIDATIDEALGAAASQTPRLDGALPEAVAADYGAVWGVAINDSVRAGALRLAGFLRSPQASSLVLAAAVHPQPDVRQAAAVALGRMDDDRSAAALEKMAHDPDPLAAFLAARSLADRGAPSDGLLQRALAVADSAPASIRQLVVDTVGPLATASQRNLLDSWRTGGDPRRETAALSALLRIDGDPRTARPLLEDPRSELVAAAIATGAGAGGGLPDWIPSLRRIANEPYPPLADSARALLAANRPADPAAALAFDLDFEHPYRRRQILEDVARQGAWDMVALGLANRDPHVRAHALDLMARHEASGARAAVVTALEDPHRAVRFAASRLVVKLAAAGDRAALEAALSQEQDPVVQLYLADALAAIGAAEPPPPRRAARSVATASGLTWVNNMGFDAESSPFGGYYCFGEPRDRDLWERASGAGKIVFVRFNPIGHPGRIIVEPGARDAFQRDLRNQVTIDTIHLLDGMVFGEESMGIGADGIWDSGWRLFCHDAGLDPQAIAGSLDNLTDPQRRAWSAWAMARTIEGFNELTAHVRGYYGRLRPGIQVGTFLPGEASTLGPWAFAWDFDIAGIYDYKGDNRLAAYNLVRRMKTIWPDRPVLWLSLGIGGYEMNPVRRTQSVPRSPLFTRGNRAYADAMTAWIAGADTGWFSTWIFVAPNWQGGLRDLKGKQILVEDIASTSPVLSGAIEYAFKGAAEDLLKPALPDVADESHERRMIEGDTGGIDDLIMDVLEGDERRAQAAATVAEQMEMFRRGFHFYRRYVYDCARVFASLPRRSPRPDVLSVRPDVNVWTRPGTPYPLVPAEALLNEFDFASDINVLPDLDLSRYRLIILHDPGAAEPRTLEAIGEWLRTVPGLLYLHGAPPRPVGVPEAAAAVWPWTLAGVLKRREDGESHRRPAAIDLHDGSGRTEAVNAVMAARLEARDDPWRILWRAADGQAALALWRDSATARGGILADALESGDAAYLKLLRESVNAVHAEHGIGTTITGPLLQIRVDDERFQAAATTRYYRETVESTVLEGIDLLSGQPHPQVGDGSSAALVPRGDFKGKHAVAGSGVTALSDLPFARAETGTDGLVVESAGLFRLSGGRASVAVTRLDGTALPVIADDQDPMAWLEWGRTDGVYVQSLGDRHGPVVFVRASTPVRAVATAAE